LSVFFGVSFELVFIVGLSINTIVIGIREEMEEGKKVNLPNWNHHQNLPLTNF